MNRLEVVNKLQDIERRKNLLEEQLKATESFYCEKVKLRFITETSDYNHKGMEEMVEVGKDGLVGYLNNEIKKLTEQSKELVNELMEKGEE